MDLTKSQKKNVRELIDKAILRDYTDGINRVKRLVYEFEVDKSDPGNFIINFIIQ